MKDIKNLINFFFITFIINSFITFYSVYNYLDFERTQNKQGLKLNIKKQALYSQTKGEDRK